MGLLQNVATLANPSANIIRPTDIMMAGQNAQQQIQGGINSITGQMAEGRKLDAQQRADTAVMNLLKEAPTGTQDPTKFNQMMGMASAYGSQGMKDTAKNAIESAREGYRTAVQQEQFGKTFGLDTKKFEEMLRSNSVNEGIKIQEISNAYDMGIRQIDANRENALLSAKTQKEVAQINANSAAASRKLQEKVFGWTQTKDIATLDAQGYNMDKSGNLSFNPNSPKYLLGLDTQFRTDYAKTKPTPDKFRELGHTRDTFGGYFTSESRYLNAYNLADKFLLSPTNSMEGITAKQQVRAAMDAGNYTEIERLLGKYK